MPLLLVFWHDALATLGLLIHCVHQVTSTCLAALDSHGQHLNRYLRVHVCLANPPLFQPFLCSSHPPPPPHLPLLDCLQEEGIVAKQLESQWKADDKSGTWLKLKPDYFHMQEVSEEWVGCLCALRAMVIARQICQTSKGDDVQRRRHGSQAHLWCVGWVA